MMMMAMTITRRLKNGGLAHVKHTSLAVVTAAAVGRVRISIGRVYLVLVALSAESQYAGHVDARVDGGEKLEQLHLTRLDQRGQIGRHVRLRRRVVDEQRRLDGRQPRGQPHDEIVEEAVVDVVEEALIAQQALELRHVNAYGHL